MSEHTINFPEQAAMTSQQLIAAGTIAEAEPRARWFASYFSEEGDFDLYLQDLATNRMWRITPGGTTSRVD